jgi:hypothetical protein
MLAVVYIAGKYNIYYPLTIFPSIDIMEPTVYVPLPPPHTYTLHLTKTKEKVVI